MTSDGGSVWRKELEERGFFVFRGLANSSHLVAVLDAIEVRLGRFRDEAVPDMDGVLRSGFFPLWNASPLWRVRELDALRMPFQIAYGTDRLWVSLDRCGYRRPCLDEARRTLLHWDDDRSRCDFALLQGVLAVTRSHRGEGEYICAPDAYRAYRAEGKEKGAAVLNAQRVEYAHVEMDPGDFLVFDYRLAHGNAQHRGGSPRVVQYVTYTPAGDSKERARRIQCWKFGSWWGRLYFPAYSMPDEQEPQLSQTGCMLLAGGPDADC